MAHTGHGLPWHRDGRASPGGGGLGIYGKRLYAVGIGRCRKQSHDERDEPCIDGNGRHHRQGACDEAKPLPPGEREHAADVFVDDGHSTN